MLNGLDYGITNNATRTYYVNIRAAKKHKVKYNSQTIKSKLNLNTESNNCRNSSTLITSGCNNLKLNDGSLPLLAIIRHYSTSVADSDI